MELRDFALIIPSLNPDEKLNNVVEDMLSVGFNRIVIVDDGSDEKYSSVFEDIIIAHPECILRRHRKNLGKGVALRTGFAYVLDSIPDVKYVITLDGDGQHKAGDVLNIARALELDTWKVVLGCRNFSSKSVPLHNKLGNKITAWVFKAFCDIKLSDTQTGLRGIPVRFLDDFIRCVEGDRYEFETNMLLYMRKASIEFMEVPIETVYIEGNHSSHFNPVKDSWKIYKLIFLKSAIFRQIVSSALCCVVDLGLFTILDSVFGHVENLFLHFLLAVGLARVLSSLLNYFVNKKYVFRSDVNTGKSMVKYYLLAALQLGLSWCLLTLLTMATGALGFKRTMLKMVIDLILFFASYFVQKNWVFKK